jgi:predicted acylesterase/phospholipase RssA
MADAIVLAGAAAKGAWSAGVLAELTEPAAQERLGLDIRRVVAVSAGAINAALLAAHVRDGTEGAAMALLEELWIDIGDTKGALDVSPRAILARRGISSSAKVRALLERFIPPSPSGTRPVDLAIVVANLNGEVDIVGSELATTYERCVQFTGDAFATKEGLAPVFDAVVASAAFPVVFEPEPITLGTRRVRCMDGGAVNNTPIKYALGEGEEIDRVFVIAPSPSVQRTPPNLHGVGLLSHLGEILVEERYLELRVIPYGATASRSAVA